jgi:hypothetical protein
VTVPIVVILALALGLANDDSAGPGARSTAPPAPLSVAAPPANPAAVAPCAKVLAELPIQVGTLAPRVVHPQPDSPFVVAWGDPAVILRCGVARPQQLRPGSSLQLFSVSRSATAGPFYDVTTAGNANVYTTVDRAVYIEVSIPVTYAVGPLPQLSDAIAKALPAVCVPQPSQGQPLPAANTLCTHRP